MRRRKLRERLLTYILCLAMVIALLPMNAITVQAEGAPQCQHCSGTGYVCSAHNRQAHSDEGFANEPECRVPCNFEGDCYVHCNGDLYECEYCTGTGTDPNWTHTHHFVYVHKDDSGENFHIAKCDYPDCLKDGDLPYSGYNCDTDGPDGACSYCGFKAEAPAHTHTKDTHHAPVAATCTNSGVVEYWECSCGKKIDSSLNEITDVTISATGNHDFADGATTCKICHICKSFAEIGKHDFSNQGDGIIKCEKCGAVYDSSAFEVDINGTHRLKYNKELKKYVCLEENCEKQFEPGYYDNKGICDSWNIVYALRGDLISVDDFTLESYDTIKIVDLDNLTSCEKNIDICESKLLNTIKLGSLTSCDFIDLSGCESLQTVDLGNLVTANTAVNFNECKMLQSVDLKSLKTVGNYINFSGCEKLQTVDLGSLTTVGYGNEFSGCESLQTVKVHKGDPCKIGDIVGKAKVTTVDHTYIASEDSSFLHKCSVCGECEKHFFVDQGDGTHKCNTCGETRIHDSADKIDSTTHKCEDCNAIEKHIFSDDGYCHVCGFNLDEDEMIKKVEAVANEIKDSSNRTLNEFLLKGIGRYNSYNSFGEYLSENKRFIESGGTWNYDNDKCEWTFRFAGDLEKISVEYIADNVVSVTLKGNIFTHNYVDGVCKDCGLCQTLATTGNHDFSDSATKCKVCGGCKAFVTLGHHDFSNGYTKCKVCDICKSVAETGSHNFANNGTCVCGAMQVKYEVISGTKTVRITGYLRYDIDKMSNLVIPNTVKVNGEDYKVVEIADSAFMGEKYIGNLIIPKGVTTIGAFAFYDCGFSGDLIIPNSVTSLKEGAFTHCGFEGEIYIPDSVTNVDRAIFSSCEGITNLSVPCSINISEIDWEIDSEKIKQRNHDLSDDGICKICNYECTHQNSEGWTVEDGKCISCGAEIGYPVDDEDKPVVVEKVLDQLWVTGIKQNLIYTGAKVEQPTMKVYWKNKLLVLNQDYTVKYLNNIKAGTATVVITGKGNYAGTIKETYPIAQIDIGNAKAFDEEITIAANGKAQKPTTTFTIEVGGKTVTLKNGTDYTYTYPVIKDKGKYEVTITGKGNYKGTKTVKVTVVDEGVAVTKLTVKKIPNQTYRDENNDGKGDQIVPDVVVMYGKKPLEKGTDYTVEVAKGANTDIGVGTVTIVGNKDNGYYGKRNVTFNIVGTPVTKATVEGLAAETYTGSGIVPKGYKVYIKATKTTGQIDLTEDKDYKVSVDKNVNAGTATVTFTGINGYSGILKKTFKINKASMTDESRISVKPIDPVEYQKNGAKPAITVMDGVRTLKENVDYTVKYTNNNALHDLSNEVKKPTVTITGKGNYVGTKSANFAIIGSSLSKDDITITATDIVASGKANTCKPVIKLTDNGVALKAGTDYETVIEYTYVNATKVKQIVNRVETEVKYAAGAKINTADIIKAGTEIRATVKGKGFYADSKEVVFRYVATNIASAKVVIPNFVYTKKAITLDENKIQVTMVVNKKAETLKFGEDFEIIGYKNNVDKGTAKVTIRGLGNYGGTKEVAFKIVSKTLNHTVRLHNNDGSGKDVVKEVGITSGAMLPANTFKVTGKKFIGWNTKADGSGEAYSDREAIIVRNYLSMLIFGDTLDLYAQWE